MHVPTATYTYAQMRGSQHANTHITEQQLPRETKIDLFRQRQFKVWRISGRMSDVQRTALYSRLQISIQIDHSGWMWMEQGRKSSYSAGFLPTATPAVTIWPQRIKTFPMERREGHTERDLLRKITVEIRRVNAWACSLCTIFQWNTIKTWILERQHFRW